MELALKDIRRHLGKFLATIVGVAMLLAIVLVMNGIYQGNIQDGVWLIDHTDVDLWVVERGRGGPFNEASRIPLDSYKSVAATPGVAGPAGSSPRSRAARPAGWASRAASRRTAAPRGGRHPGRGGRRARPRGRSGDG